MTAQTIHDYLPLVLTGLGAAGVLFVLHQVGKGLKSLFEVLATIAVVAVALWLAIKVLVRFGRFAVTHWRSTLAALAAGVWCWLLGWQSLVITLGVLVVLLSGWRLAHRPSFDPWCGQYLRAWWLRWTIYARKLPKWLRNCGLTVRDERSVTVNVNPFTPTRFARTASTQGVEERPKILKVRSGLSWDEVHLRLVPGQTPEDFDAAARALAVSRKVDRAQVRELRPNVVSLDFQRRNLLRDAVPCGDLAHLASVAGSDIDLSRVFTGRTDYGTPFTLSLQGGHMLGAGATGSGKGSLMWAPLVSIAPAIRDGLVRVWGIDPKGMELAYGRGVFADRYAVTAKDAITMLESVIAEMEARKAAFAGKVRTVPISTEYPLELIEFDEIGALTRYTSRANRDKITELVSLLTTQGRALGITVRGYVQEPTKDTVPVRDLFPRRLCLRVAARSHVGMVLGDQAYERGAWANRIGESEAGVGYLFGEGIREPLRVRAAWVSDDTIKALEAFVTGRQQAHPGRVFQLPHHIEATRIDRDGVA